MCCRLFLLLSLSLPLWGKHYEQVKPQFGIYYFTSGGAARVRRGNIGRTDLTAKGFDPDNHFMVMEIEGDKLFFQTISRTGTTVDSRVITGFLARAMDAAAK